MLWSATLSVLSDAVVAEDVHGDGCNPHQDKAVGCMHMRRVWWLPYRW